MSHLTSHPGKPSVKSLTTLAHLYNLFGGPKMEIKLVGWPKMENPLSLMVLQVMRLLGG